MNATHLAALQDASFRVERNGKVKPDSAKTSFVNRVALVFRSSVESQERDASELFSIHEWELFQKGVKIRNRITHPSSVEDLEMSDEILNVCVVLYFGIFKLWLWLQVMR